VRVCRWGFVGFFVCVQVGVCVYNYTYVHQCFVRVELEIIPPGSTSIELTTQLMLTRGTIPLMSDSNAKSAAASACPMGQGGNPSGLDVPRGSAPAGGVGYSTGVGWSSARVHDGQPEPRRASNPAASRSPSPTSEEKSRPERSGHGTWQAVPPPRRWRRKVRNELDKRCCIVWGLSHVSQTVVMARELRILGLGEVEVEFAGRGSGRHLRLKCASSQEAEKMVRLLRERKFFTGKVHVAMGRTFREREKQRAARGGAQYEDLQKELRKQGLGYWVLDVEVDEPQGEASGGESPSAEWGGLRELEELGRRVQDGPWRVAEGPKRAHPKRRHRHQLRSAQFVKGFPLRVASHNWQGKVGVDSPGFGEWPEHYKQRGWMIVGVQEHNLSSQRVQKLQVDGFAVLGQAAAIGAGSRLLGGVLTLVANYLAPCATIVQAPVPHPQQLWVRLSSGSATASEVFVGNGYFPQENQREESIAAYEAWQAAISYFATKGHVVTVGDANAKLGPARKAREEGVVGPFGEIDEKGRGVRSENGELLAAVLVATGLRNLSGFSQPRGDKYWWSRQEHVGGRLHLLDYICVSPQLAEEAKFGVDEVDLDTDHKAVWAELVWGGQPPPKKQVKRYKAFKAERLIGRVVEGNESELSKLRSKYDEAFAADISGLLPDGLPDLSGARDPDELQQVVDRVSGLVVRAFTGAATKVLGVRVIRPGFTNSWFDETLREAIARRRVAYGSWRRNEASQESWQRYVQARKAVRKLCKEKKEQAWKRVQNETAAKFRSATMATYWKMSKRLGGVRRAKVSAPVRRPDGTLACTLREKLEEWEQYRQRMVVPKDNQFLEEACVEELGSDEDVALIEPERTAREPFRYNDDLRDQFEAMVQAEEVRDELGPLDYDYTEAEVKLCQGNLQNHKACSPDKIKNEMLKYGGAQIVSFLVRFFNWLKSCECTPSDWGKAIIVNIPKGGDPTDPENWRDIAILSCLGKMYLSLMAARLTEFIDYPGRLRPEQGGFRPKRGTGDQIFVLKERLRLRQKAGLPSFVLFVDLRKAFPTVWRVGLFQRLIQMGVQGKFYRILRRFYRSTSSRVLVDGELTGEVLEEMGVQQGSPLSPSLFNVFMDELTVRIAKALKIEDLNRIEDIRTLLYADDVAVIAHSVTELQQIVNVVASFVEDYRLEINLKPGKTEVMPIYRHAKSKKSPPRVLFRGRVLNVTDHYKYLGVLLTDTLSDIPQAKRATEVTVAGTAAYYPLWIAHEVPARLRLMNWQQMVGAKLLYASAFWNLPGANQKGKLEGALAAPLRVILGVGARTSGCIARGLGRTPSFSILAKAARLRFLGRIELLSNTALTHRLYNTGKCKWKEDTESLIFADHRLREGLDALKRVVNEEGTVDDKDWRTALADWNEVVKQWSVRQEVAGWKRQTKPTDGLRVLLSQMSSRSAFPRWRALEGGRHNLIRRRLLSCNNRLRLYRSKLSSCSPDCSSCFALCGAEVNESLRHFLLHCPMFASSRAALFRFIDEAQARQPLALNRGRLYLRELQTAEEEMRLFKEEWLKGEDEKMAAMLGVMFTSIPEEIEEELAKFVATIWKEWEDMEAQIREAEGAGEEEVIDLTVAQEAGRRRRGRPRQVERLARFVVGGGQRSVADFFSADNPTQPMHSHTFVYTQHARIPVESLERSRVTKRPRDTNGGTCPKGSLAN